MKIITTNLLKFFLLSEKRAFEELLPELVKRLILAERNPQRCRIPDGDDIWNPGFDGVIEMDTPTTHVVAGRSCWEFGTQKDPVSKIESDYAKRTDNTSEDIRRETTLYLVTPYLWTSSISIVQWEKEHSAWAKTIVYDGTVLADWMNEQPSVCSWFISKFSKQSVSFYTICDSWENFSNLTNPALSKSLFLNERVNEMDRLLSIIRSQRIIRVKADSLYDARGFVLSSMCTDDELCQNAIVVKDYNSYKTLSELVKEKVIILDFYCDADLQKDENYTIICYGKEACAIREDIRLPQLQRRQIEQGAIAMGMSQSDATELYHNTHGNLGALIRRIPGTSNVPVPEWTSESDLSLLYPLLFLGTIKRSKDRKLVESLSKTEYDKVEAKYLELARLEDSPVKVAGDYFMIINSEEVWNYLNPDPEGRPFNNLIDTICELIESNPVSAGVGIYRRGVSVEQQLLSNLVWYSYSHGESNTFKNAIVRLLAMRFEKNHAVYNNLNTIAEASPEFCLSSLREDFDNKQSFVHVAFETNQYFSILMALEELTLHENTAHSACEILYELSCKDREYYFYNNPINSLSSSLMLVNTYSALSISEKIAMLKSFISRNAKWGTDFVATVICAKHFYRCERIGKREAEKYERLTVQSYNEAVFELSRCMILKCLEVSYVKPIIELVKHCWVFLPDDLMNLALLFDSCKFENSDLVELDFVARKIECEILDHVESEAYEKAIQSWRSRIVVEDPVLTYAWVFREYYTLPEITMRDCYPDLDDGKTLDYRKRVFLELFTTFGRDGVLPLAAFMDNSNRWADVLACAQDSELPGYFCSRALEQKKYGLLAGCLGIMEFDRIISFIQTVPLEEKKLILPIIPRIEISDSLSEEDKSLFWSHKVMYQYDEKFYSNLLIYNPQGLLYYCSQIVEKKVDSVIDTVSDVILAVIQSHPDNQTIIQNQDLIEKIVKSIDEFFYSEEWARICIQLLDMGFLDSYPEGVGRYFFDNPQELTTRLKSPYRTPCSFTLPLCAFHDYERLKGFLVLVMKEVDRFCVARMVAVTFNGNDGFPLMIKQFLEDVASVDLDKDIASIIASNYGYEWKYDGTKQRALAEKYKLLSKQIEPQFYHSRNVVMELERDYRTEAIREDLYGEIS